MKHNPKIAPLGARAKCRITGYEGVVVSVAYHITGCERIGVRALDEPGEADATVWFYEAELDINEDWGDEYIDDDPITSTAFDLGWRLRDRVTGAKGVATTINFNLYNCPRAALTPVEDEPPEEPQDRFWFDAPRLEVVDRPSDASLVESLGEWFTNLRDAGTASTGAAGVDSRRKTNDGRR